MGFVANFVRFPAVHKFWKSVKIWQSYGQLKGGNCFETQCSLCYVMLYMYVFLSIGLPLCRPTVPLLSINRMFRLVSETSSLHLSVYRVNLCLHLTHTTLSSSVNSPLTSSITPLLLHFRLKNLPVSERLPTVDSLLSARLTRSMYFHPGRIFWVMSVFQFFSRFFSVFASVTPYASFHLSGARRPSIMSSLKTVTNGKY